jgi:xanthine dehydrogenase accessory factor
MSHLASADLAALQVLATREISYVGLLGPPPRRDELLGQLEPGQRDALQGRLHAPVGLALGGEGPEAIALAIVAELQRHFHAR